jgi:NAD(P)-dependent dehydrogenase (short-subunit alcohol dehydrogenase family)
VHGSAFTVRPDNREHHRLLLDAVRREHGLVTAVIHAWEAGPAAEPEAAAHYRCALSVLALLQALAANPAPLLLLTTNGVWARPGDKLVPVRSTLPGLIRTALTEQAVPVVRQVDLPADAPDAWAAAIRTELSCTEHTAVVAHRGRERLVPRLRAVAPKSAPEGMPTFVPGGIYLLTGGLGGIGQVVAEYLLTEVKAKLLLIGRSLATSEENGRRLAELAALGEVDYQLADVADITALTAAVDRAERRWAQPLAGVLHLAGADVSHRWQRLEEHTLVNELPDSFFDMYGPKVSGTLALAKLLADRPSTTLILFSSVNAEFGGLSFGAYSSANSFLNGFADHWGREHGRPVCSISWSSWAGIGMSRGSPTDAARSRGFCAIPEEAGIRLLAEALALGYPNLIAGLDPANVNILREMLPEQLKPAEVLLAYAAHAEIDNDVLRTALGDAASNCALPLRFMWLDQLPVDQAARVDRDQLLGMATPGNSSRARQYVEPRTDLERELAAIWSEVLKRRQIGREDGFFEIGGNSVLAVQIVSRIDSKLGVKVPIHQLYENPRIGLLADALTAEEHK